MADVGKSAQVSAQTVSRYFTGGYVGVETRQRIQRAIDDLGYRHNRIARNLCASRTDTVGVLSMGPVNYGNSSILTGFSSAARNAGISLITTHLDIDTSQPSSIDEIRHALDAFLSFQVDGVIVGTPYLGTEKLLDYLGEAVPVVTLSDLPNRTADSASADSYGAGFGATEHLIGLGHRAILHVAGPANRNESAGRLRGYQDALAAAGLAALPPLVSEEWTAAAGAAQGRLADPTTFTAVFAADDLLALGFLRAMEERGLSAPRDFSIIGVDDMPEVAFYSPPLTTMRLDFVELGRTALEMIVARVHSGERQQRRVITAELQVRASTGPVTSDS